jgi:transposase
MGRFAPNGGITESFHTIMELMSRPAFGFRNNENCRMPVKLSCG